MKQIFNPFLPENIYIPDGEPHVFGDRLYLFGSHDQENGDSFCMLDYEGWSTPVNDLGKWESAGIIYCAKQDPLWTEQRPYLYAPDVVQGNDGKFYLYYCLSGWKGSGGYDGPVSVAVCDTPNGKYQYHGYVRNPNGSVFDSCILFDPAVINDDGVIRLYCGTNLYMGLEITKWNRFIMAGVASAMYHRPKEAFRPDSNPLGAYTVELEDDMLTVRGLPKKIIPRANRENGFLGHGYYEGPSIRKIGNTYYFIYSSQKNHELCYATSNYPDRDFIYGGTIVSTGDVGFHGRKDKNRLNVTGTTHGSIECINGQWYVFYHRLSHGSDYSRQACAEPITICEDGKIEQVEVSSCGLNGGPLNPEGIIPATKVCVLSNGKMPHISNKKMDGSIPMITNLGDEYYITGLKNGAFFGFRWFAFDDCDYSLTINCRGEGKLGVYTDLAFQESLAYITINSHDWHSYDCFIHPARAISPLYFKVESAQQIEISTISFCSASQINNR